MSRTLRAFAASVGGVAVTQVLAAGASVLIARLLGPQLRGVYGLLVLAVSVAGVIATMGVEVWISHSVASGGTPEAVVRRVALRQVRLAFAGTVLGLSLLGVLPRAFSATEYLSAAVMVLATSQSMLRLAFLGGWLRMQRVALAQILGATTYLAFAATLLTAGRQSVGLVLFGGAVATSVIALATGVRLREPSSAPLTEVRSAVRDARRLGRPAMLGELLSVATYRADLILIAAMLGERAVGLYLVAAAVSEVLWIIPNGLAQALLPRVAADRRPDVTRSVLSLTTAAGIVGAVAVSAAAPLILPTVFGDPFRDAVPAVLPLCAAAVVLGIWKLTIADLAGRGNTAIRVSTSAIALVAMLAFDFVAVPRWGLIGAGMGALVGYSGAAVVALREWLRATGVRPRTLICIAEPARLVAGLVRTEHPTDSTPQAHS